MLDDPVRAAARRLAKRQGRGHGGGFPSREAIVITDAGRWVKRRGTLRSRRLQHEGMKKTVSRMGLGADHNHTVSPPNLGRCPALELRPREA